MTSPGQTSPRSKTVGFFRMKFRDCTTTVRSATCVTMVRPALEDASAVWDTYKQNDAQLLGKVRTASSSKMRLQQPQRQNTLYRTITARWSEMNSLEQRRLYSRVQMLYRISSRLLDINLARFCQHADPRTRGAQRVHQEHTNHLVLFNPIFPRTVRDWNHLPTAITSATSL